MVNVDHLSICFSCCVAVAVASRGSGANIKADGILGRKDSKGLSSTTSSQPGELLH